MSLFRGMLFLFAHSQERSKSLNVQPFQPANPPLFSLSDTITTLKKTLIANANAKTKHNLLKHNGIQNSVNTKIAKRG